jgi:general secretion pathway protein B
MSIILDALKKSESDRQRHSGPALFEVRVAPPRTRFPVWAMAVAALLAVNVGVVSWLMLRRPQSTAQAATPTTSPGSPAQQTLPSAARTAPVSTAAAIPVPPATPPPATTTAAAAAPAQGESPSAVDPVSAAGPADSAPSEPVLADARPASAAVNPDDYAPAQEPDASPAIMQSHVRTSAETNLPTYEDIASKGPMPSLRLDLHVYAPDPAQRFVFINMRKLREGESTPDGVRVESITSNGVVLNYRGANFVMERR